MSSNAYFKLFAIPGAVGFSLTAFLGRLPAGMISLAIILPIAKLLGSYSIAGAVTASTMAGMALCAPLSGRLVDRYGQSKILLLSTSLNIVGTLALIISIELKLSILILCLTGFVTGATRLSTGTMARTRWAYVITQFFNNTQRQTMLQTAYAFEAIVDEVVFILAPMLAALLCAFIAPLAALVFCFVSYGIGAIGLALQHTTQPKLQAKQQKHKPAYKLPTLQVIFATILFIGIAAGAVEVIVVARAYHLGSRSLAGFLMAILASSSMLTGFCYGTCAFKCSAYLCWLRCISLLFLALIPFIFATNFIMLTIAMFFAGLFIGPTSIAGQVLTEHILPTNLLNEGMNIVVTAMILGMAGGAWLSGMLIDLFGAYWTGILPTAAVLIALTIAFSFRFKVAFEAYDR